MVNTVRVLEWLDEMNFKAGGHAFRFYNFFSPERPAQIHPVGVPVYNIAKPRWRLDAYVTLLEKLRPKQIVELGVFQGGSAVLLDVLCQPDKLVTIEYKPDPVAPLEEYIETNSRDSAVKTFYGTDQSDREKVIGIIDEEFGVTPIDFVIDDASHMLYETRESFSMIFPRMRSGGVYVIEDWTWAHQNITNTAAPEGMHPDKSPLSILAIELLMIVASTEGIIADVRFDKNSMFVKRGEAPWSSDYLDLSGLYHARAGRMLNAASSGG